MRQVEEYVKSSRKQTLRRLSEVFGGPGGARPPIEALAGILRGAGFRIALAIDRDAAGLRADLPAASGRTVILRAGFGRALGIIGGFGDLGRIFENIFSGRGPFTATRARGREAEQPLESGDELLFVVPAEVETELEQLLSPGHA